LRQEKRTFLDFQQTQNDLERLTRLVVAYDYLKSKEKLHMSEKDLNDKRERAMFLESNAEKLKNEIAFLQEDMDKVKAARDKELRKGGKFQALEDKVKEHSHELVRLTTVLDLKKSSMTEEKENREKSQAAVQELGHQLEQKSQLHKQLQDRYDAANAELQKQTASRRRNSSRHYRLVLHLRKVRKVGTKANSKTLATDSALRQPNKNKPSSRFRIWRND
jgi:structural maintenance of chromosome 2